MQANAISAALPGGPRGVRWRQAYRGGGGSGRLDRAGGTSRSAQTGAIASNAGSKAGAVAGWVTGPATQAGVQAEIGQPDRPSPGSPHEPQPSAEAESGLPSQAGAARTTIDDVPRTITIASRQTMKRRRDDMASRLKRNRVPAAIKDA